MEHHLGWSMARDQRPGLPWGTAVGVPAMGWGGGYRLTCRGPRFLLLWAFSRLPGVFPWELLVVPGQEEDED